MANFKQLNAAKRAAIPQIDPEASPPAPTVPPAEPAAPAPVVSTTPQVPSTPPTADAVSVAPQLTQVDTSESAVNRGFFMYPSRHRQVVHDLVYIENRKPWMIIEDALEEYVVRHYKTKRK